jgi:hypothetical protein
MAMTGRFAACVVAVLAAVLAPAAVASDPLVGSWAGSWMRGGERLDLAIDIRPGDAPGRYQASLSSRGLGRDGVPAASARHDGCCGIQLVLRADTAATHFRATVQGGELRGTSAEDGGARGTFALHRVSQAREESR